MQLTKKKQTAITPLTSEQALNMIITAKLSKESYKSIRKLALEHNSDMYPSYYELSLAKEKIYPKNVSISEKICEVSLQNLLNNTAERILQYLKVQHKITCIGDHILFCK